jgi:hypothetical protein
MTRGAPTHLVGACLFNRGHFLSCDASENPISPNLYLVVDRLLTVATGGFVFRCGRSHQQASIRVGLQGRAPDLLCAKDAQRKPLQKANQSLCRSSTMMTRRCTTVAFTSPVTITVGLFDSVSSFSVWVRCFSANHASSRSLRQGRRITDLGSPIAKFGPPRRHACLKVLPQLHP